MSWPLATVVVCSVGLLFELYCAWDRGIPLRTRREHLIVAGVYCVGMTAAALWR